MRRAEPQRIALLSDFGSEIYVGQMRAWLSALLPELTVIDLIHDLPVFQPDLASHLMAALVRDMPARTLFIAVVDPGVGGPRDLLAAFSGDQWFLAPDNGLLSQVLARNPGAEVARVGWRPPRLTPSFHGRDWFVPLAARWCHGGACALTRIERTEMVGADWPEHLARVLYQDRFGNLLTGVDARSAPVDRLLLAAGRALPYARTFCAVGMGSPFWYLNSLGLVEIAVNQGHAGKLLDLQPGDPVGPLVDAADLVVGAHPRP